MPTTNSPKTDIVPVRVTPVMRRQIDELAQAGHGSQSDVIRTAVDRMHQQEKRAMISRSKIPHDAKYGWYDATNGSWTGAYFSSREAAQRAINVDFLNGDVSADGEDADGWYVVAVNGDESDIITPAVVTNETLQAMIATALDCWDFDCDGCAAVGVELHRMQGAEVEPVELNQNIASSEDFDGLQEWMERIANA